MKDLLALRVKNLREKAGLSQKQLADKAETPQSTISEIEQAQRMPRGDTLSQIALALGTTTSYLLGETKKVKAS